MLSYEHAQEYQQTQFVVILTCPPFIGAADKVEAVNGLLTVLHVLKQFGFCLRLDKCQLFQTEEKVLGRIINKQGIKLDKTCVNKILNFPQIRNKKMVEVITGLLN